MFGEYKNETYECGCLIFCIQIIILSIGKERSSLFSVGQFAETTRIENSTMRLLAQYGVANIFCSVKAMELLD